MGSRLRRRQVGRLFSSQSDGKLVCRVVVSTDAVLRTQPFPWQYPQQASRACGTVLCSPPKANIPYVSGLSIAWATYTLQSRKTHRRPRHLPPLPLQGPHLSPLSKAFESADMAEVKEAAERMRLELPLGSSLQGLGFFRAQKRSGSTVLGSGFVGPVHKI